MSVPYQSFEPPTSQCTYPPIPDNGNQKQTRPGFTQSAPTESPVSSPSVAPQEPLPSVTAIGLAPPSASTTGQPVATTQPPLRSGKSAVSELHELSVQRGLPLNWMQESECGPAHCKLFSMKVTMGLHEATGSGRSKKLAKQVAAQNLLNQLQQKSTPKPAQYGPQLPDVQQKGPSADSTDSTASASQSTLPHDNPISKLQEVTKKHGLGFPEYEVVSEDGPQVLQRFDIKVKLNNLESSGLGRSKKTAKRNAAQAMLDQLSKTHSTIEPPQKRIAFVPATDSK